MQDKNKVRELIGDKPDPIIFEIGSADGIDTRDFISAFNDLNFKMYCFEPDKRNLKVFKDTVHDKRVNLFEGVIGNITGDVTFYTSTKSFVNDTELIYSSSLKPPGKPMFEVPEWKGFFQSEKNWEPTVVKSITLDDFVSQNNISYISYVYADVQGSEDLMILGGTNTFRNKVRFLYTEYSNIPFYQNEPSLQDILNLLPNYELVQDFGSDVLLKNKDL